MLQYTVLRGDYQVIVFVWYLIRLDKHLDVLLQSLLLVSCSHISPLFLVQSFLVFSHLYVQHLQFYHLAVSFSFVSAIKPTLKKKKHKKKNFRPQCDTLWKKTGSMKCMTGLKKNLKKSRALNTWGWKFKEYTVGLIFLMTYSQSDQCRSNWW